LIKQAESNDLKPYIKDYSRFQLTCQPLLQNVMNRILKALRDRRKVLQLQEEKFREEASFYRQQTQALKEETSLIRQQTKALQKETLTLKNIMKEIDYINAWTTMNTLQEKSHQLDTIKALVKQLEEVILRKAEIHSDSSVCYSLTQVIQLMIDSYLEEFKDDFLKAWEATVTQIHKQNTEQASQDLQELVGDPSVLIGLE
jgi:hypothetical protein